MTVLKPTVLNNPSPSGEQRPTQDHLTPPQHAPTYTPIRSGGGGLPIRGAGEGGLGVHHRSAEKPM